MIADSNISMLQNLALLCNLCERVLNRHLDELGLTATQAKVLGYLFSQADEHNVNQRDIENAFFLTNPTVTGILKRLESKGYITRVPSTEDGRCKVIRLTAKSHRQRRDMLCCASQMEALMLKGLTPEELSSFNATLCKLLQNIPRH